MKKLTLLLLTLPLFAEAQVYQCQSAGDTYFAQIPCDDTAEEIVIIDRKMNNDESDGHVAAEKEIQEEVEAEKTPQQRLEAFVATLERQRDQQLDIINTNISNMENQISTEKDSLSEPELAAFNAELRRLKAAYDSVDNQYQTMITEANSRASMLSKN